MTEPLALDAVTAVVVNWNQPDYTLRAVEALVADGLPEERVVVVDNGSTDDSAARLSALVGACVLARSEENVGFARGTNAGAALLPGEAYLLVNSDAFVHRPGTLRALLSALAAPGVGIVVPRLLNEDLTLQRSVSPAPRPGVALVRALGAGALVPNRLRSRWSTGWDHRSSADIDAATGAVLLVEGALWEELGGLRERSFMYAEDIDLCWRARERGRRVRFAADAEFVHVGGGSTRTRWDAAARGERVARAEAAMVEEHLDPLRARATLGLLRLAFALRLVLRTLLRQREAAAECRGLVRGYRTGAVAQEEPPAPVRLRLVERGRAV